MSARSIASGRAISACSVTSTSSVKPVAGSSGEPPSSVVGVGVEEERERRVEPALVGGAQGGVARGEVEREHAVLAPGRLEQRLGAERSSSSGPPRSSAS